MVNLKLEKLKINTQRLTIRNLEMTDLVNFHVYRSNPDVTKYQGFDVMDEQQARGFIEKQKDKLFGKPGEWVQYAIEKTDEAKLIGDCAIKLDEHEPRIAHIGVTLNPDYQKKGFGKEVLHGIVSWLFETKNVHRITETVDIKNANSIHLLESLGFKKEGFFVDCFFENGKWGSEYQYVMLNNEK